MPEGYDARPEQAILFTIEAWDVNCPQHIPQKFDAADVAAAVEKLEHRIGELETENAYTVCLIGLKMTRQRGNMRIAKERADRKNNEILGMDPPAPTFCVHTCTR